MDHYKHYYQEDNTNEIPMLHLELDKTGAEFNLKLHGNPVTVANMIAQGMNARQEIAAAIIAGVLSWCKENNINPDNLKDMVKFHGEG